MDYDRFKNSIHYFQNVNGVSLAAIFEQRKSDAKYVGILEGFENLENAKDCSCLSSINEDEEGICRCNYHILSRTHSINEVFNKCIGKVITKANKLVRCSNCTTIHKQFQYKKLCGSCVIQKMIDKRSKSIGKCSICYGKMYIRNKTKLNCGHTFHRKCINKVINRVCPLCRNTI